MKYYTDSARSPEPRSARSTRHLVSAPTRCQLAKREAEDFGATVEELDLKTAVEDRSGLTDQLIYPLLHNRALPVGVDISSVGRRGALTVEEHAKSHARSLSRRPHHEVHVARVELVRDSAVRAVERARVGADGPVSHESPTVEPEGLWRRIGARFVPHCTAARIESGGLIVAEVALRRPEVLPVGLNFVPVRFDRSQPGPLVFDARISEQLPEDRKS